MTIISYKDYEWNILKQRAYLQTKRPCCLDKVYMKCSDCNNRATCWDHRDYLKPNEVDPVCVSCNKKRGPARPIEVSELSEKLQRNYYQRQFELAVLRSLNHGNSQKSVAKSLNIEISSMRKMVKKFRRYGMLR